MNGIFEKLTEYIKEILLGMIESNLTDMFTDVNGKVGTIAMEVGQTPQGWNNNIFNLIRSLSETVIIPIAGIVITFVLCYELISMIIDRNNLHDIDTWIFFKWIFKSMIAIYLVTHTFDIIMAIFDVAQNIVSSASAVISTEANIDISSSVSGMILALEDKGLAELIGISLETTLVKFIMDGLSVLITVILYGRMIEIYLVSSVGPVPLATMANREWGQVGNNYLRGLIALGFQGFFIMVCVGIYAVLVRTITITDNIHASIFMILSYSILLAFSLFKTGSVAKSVLNAH
jgi:hypothetical protein